MVTFSSQHIQHLCHISILTLLYVRSVRTCVCQFSLLLCSSIPAIPSSLYQRLISQNLHCIVCVVCQMDTGSHTVIKSLTVPICHCTTEMHYFAKCSCIIRIYCIVLTIQRVDFPLVFYFMLLLSKCWVVPSNITSLSRMVFTKEGLLMCTNLIFRNMPLLYLLLNAS